MADVLSREEVARVRALVLYEGSGERWDAEELADSHEELRARLGSAAAALRQAMKMQCHVNGSPAELCGCKACRGLQAALGAAGEEQERPNA